MTTSSRLAAHRANAPAIEANAASDDDMLPQTQPRPDEDEDEDESQSGKKKEKPYMTDDEHKAALAAARAEAFAEANTRMNAVLASEHYTGRTKLAADLLANDKLSADEIISILSASAPATTPDPEAAARDEMKSALAANANSKIEANDGGVSKPEAKSADVWAAAHAKVFGTNKTA